MNAYLTINTVPELACLLLAVVFLGRDKDPFWRMLILYLFLTCMVELAGIYIHKVLQRSNMPLYTVFVLFECFAVSSFFFALLRPYGLKRRWLAAWLAVFILTYFAELLAGHFHHFVSVTTSLMSVAFVLAALCYYYLLLNADKFERLTLHAAFWWTNGSFIFYFGGTVCNLFFDILIAHPASVYTHSIRYIIFGVSDVILYTCWSLSFLCRYLQRRSTPSSA